MSMQAVETIVKILLVFLFTIVGIVLAEWARGEIYRNHSRDTRSSDYRKARREERSFRKQLKRQMKHNYKHLKH